MQVLQPYVKVIAVEAIAQSRALLSHEGSTDDQCIQVELFSDVVFIHDELISVEQATGFNAFNFIDAGNPVADQVLDAMGQRLTDEQISKLNDLLR